MSSVKIRKLTNIYEKKLKPREILFLRKKLIWCQRRPREHFTLAIYSARCLHISINPLRKIGRKQKKKTLNEKFKRFTGKSNECVQISWHGMQIDNWLGRREGTFLTIDTAIIRRNANYKRNHNRYQFVIQLANALWCDVI